MFEEGGEARGVPASSLAPIPGPRVDSAGGAHGLPEFVVEPCGPWAQAVASPGLLAELVAYPVQQLTDHAVVLGAVVALDRLAGMVQAQQLRALARFAELSPDDDPGSNAFSRYAADEVGPALGWSRRGAANRLHLAHSAATRVPAVLDALVAGDIDLPRASTVIEATYGLSDRHAATVADQVLASGRSLPYTAFGRAVRDAVTAVDPHAAEARRRQGVAARRVATVDQDDGMSWLGALLPAETAHALYDRINRLATAAKTPDDPRGLDARRADVFADLLRMHPTQRWSRVDTTAQINVTVPASTLLGLDDGPGHLDGYGAIPASVVRELAEKHPLRRLLTDPVTGNLLDYGRTTYRPPVALADHVRARYGTCVFPGCQVQARRCDLDHRFAFHKGGRTAEHNMAPLCRTHHGVKQRPDWKLDHVGDGILQWTAPSGWRYQVKPQPPGGPPQPTTITPPPRNADPPPF